MFKGNTMIQRKKVNKMKKMHYLYGIIAGMAIIIVLLVTSFEIAAYSNFKWYEKEYKKYDVCAELEMEMEDVMYVTEEMMDYLHGKRADLVVDTVVDGAEREFFNDREKMHMVDVLKMFQWGLDVRLVSALVAVFAIMLFAFTKGCWKKVLPISFAIGSGTFIGIAALIGGIFASDFNKYFIMFHHMFFDNDLWLLDPATDLMIRMLPEGFFFDMVIRIVVIFLISMLAFFGGSFYMWKKK